VGGESSSQFGAASGAPVFGGIVRPPAATLPRINLINWEFFALLLAAAGRGVQKKKSCARGPLGKFFSLFCDVFKLMKNLPGFKKYETTSSPTIKKKKLR